MKNEFPTFERFFRACHGFDPYPWQSALARRVTEGGRWPDTLAVTVPTGAGKTHILDLALYAAALAGAQRPGARFPRRTFLAVDRRSLVDQAWRHAQKLFSQIASGGDPALDAMRDALNRLSVHEPLRNDLDRENPEHRAMLDARAVRLRGGVESDPAWCPSPDLVQIIATTTDQLGSRLLGRAYGTKPGHRPIETGLVSVDALHVLDEAHISGVFASTLMQLRDIERRRGRCFPPLVTMTATPGSATCRPMPAAATPTSATASSKAGSDGSEEVALTDADRAYPRITRRLEAGRAIRWMEGNFRQACHRALKQADEAAGRNEPRGTKLLCVANTVRTAVEWHRTARQVKRRKKGVGIETVLVTGRMRTLERDRLIKVIEQKLEDPASEMRVIATQVVEAGLDWDFDALITECASWDALRQRLGRVNRKGDLANPADAAILPAKRSMTIFARAAVPVAGAKDPESRSVGQSDEKVKYEKLKVCPVYGETELRTARWLAATDAANGGPWTYRPDAGAADQPSPPPAQCVRKPAEAPLLIEEYLRHWNQNRAEGETYAVEPYLREPTGDDDVQIIWRDFKAFDIDIERDVDDAGRTDRYTDEAFRKTETQDAVNDILSTLPPHCLEAASVRIGGVRRWLRNDNGTYRSVVVYEPSDGRGRGTWKILDAGKVLRPGRTIVVPAEYGGMTAGKFLESSADERPAAAESDVQHGEEIHATSPASTNKERYTRFGTFTGNRDGDERRPVEDISRDALIEGRQLDYKVRQPEGVDFNASETQINDELDEWIKNKASSEDRELRNLEIWKRQRVNRYVIFTRDNGNRKLDRGKRTLLSEHLEATAEGAKKTAKKVGPGAGIDENIERDIEIAARWHDAGKLDDRFQNLLGRGSGEPLAHSGHSAAERRRRTRNGPWPAGERHENLSVGIVRRYKRHAEAGDPDLVEHLIATHHGWNRPFSRLTESTPETEDYAITLNDLPSANETGARMARLIERYGIAQLCYYEAVLRLVDHEAAADRGKKNHRPTTKLQAQDAARQRPAEIEPATGGGRDAAEPPDVMPIRTMSGRLPGDYMTAVGLMHALHLAAEPGSLSWAEGTPVVHGTTENRLHIAARRAVGTFRCRWPANLNKLSENEWRDLLETVPEPFRALVTAMGASSGAGPLDFISAGRGGFADATNTLTDPAGQTALTAERLHGLIRGPRTMVKGGKGLLRWAGAAAMEARRGQTASSDKRWEPWVEYLSLLGAAAFLSTPRVSTDRRSASRIARIATGTTGFERREFRWPLWKQPLSWPAIHAAIGSSPQALPDAEWFIARVERSGKQGNEVCHFGPSARLLRYRKAGRGSGMRR